MSETQAEGRIEEIERVCPVCGRTVVVGVKFTGRIRLSRHTLPGSRVRCRGSRHTIERATEIAVELLR